MQSKHVLALVVAVAAIGLLVALAGCSSSDVDFSRAGEGGAGGGSEGPAAAGAGGAADICTENRSRFCVDVNGEPCCEAVPSVGWICVGITGGGRCCAPPWCWQNR